MTDALATVIPAAIIEDRPDWLDLGLLRRALRHYALAPGSREQDRPPEVAAA
jgi:integrase